MKLHAVWIAAGIAAMAAAPAAAEEFTCRGSVGARSLDNILVPQGATCRLDGTFAKGSIVVKSGATLIASSIEVEGNIQSEGARRVNVINGSVVGGSVQITNGGTATIVGATIDSDLQLFDNAGALKASNNTIGGNLQAKQNTGGLIIQRNRIDGALQCSANNPAPTGGRNRASDKEDQCAKL